MALNRPVARQLRGWNRQVVGHEPSGHAAHFPRSGNEEMRSCVSARRSNFSTRGGISGISQRTVRCQRGYKKGFTASSFLTPLEPSVISSSGESTAPSTQAPAAAKPFLLTVDMDPARIAVEAPAQGSAPVGAVSAPPSTAAPSTPTSGLRGVAQPQAGATGAQASATSADAELLPSPRRCSSRPLAKARPERLPSPPPPPPISRRFLPAPPLPCLTR